LHRHQANGLAYYTFESMQRFPELVQGVTTRHGGVSTGPFASLNLSTGLGDDPAAVDENLNRVCQAFGVRRAHVVSPNQRHTANVRRVDKEDRGQIWAGYDALITNHEDVPLVLRYADCTPVLIYDPVHRGLALVHSGWRGTVHGITRAAVEALICEYGSRPSELVAAIGPSIGPCCYEVGEDVVGAVRKAFLKADDLLPGQQNGRRHFDLWAANRRWLAEAGIRQIETCELCTACNTADFYSHRAGGGRTGHFAAIMGLRTPEKTT
jgi:polyphenol oxidase